MNEPLTLIDKLWSAHEIARREDGAALLWVDRHYLHEGVFHSFSELRARGGTVAEPGLTFAVADHYVPTRNRGRAIADPEIAGLIHDLEANAAANHIKLFGLGDPRQGIVHVVGPEQGLTLPGLLIVCGDSHTSTHGAFGAYAFGIGSSEVAHVLMTQTLVAEKAEAHARHCPRQGGRGYRRQGYRSVHHRAHRRRRGTGPCDRIRRQRDCGAVDGRPHDAVQHVDRGRRPLRRGRARCDHVCLSQGPTLCAQGSSIRQGGRSLVRARLRRRRFLRPRG